MRCSGSTGIPAAAWRLISIEQFYSPGSTAGYLHVNCCQLCGDSLSMWHSVVATRQEVSVSYPPEQRGLFVMASLYASMHAAGLMVCLFICVCGPCPVSAEGEFEKDTIVVE